MGRNDFDKELDSYLSQRKGKSFKVENVIEWFRQLIPRKVASPSVEMPPDVEAYEEETKKEEMEELEVIEDLDQDYEEKKSIFNRLIEKINSFKKNPVVKEAEMATELEEEKIKDLVEKEMLVQDMRDLAKIALYVVKQLPANDLKRFKSSSDFDDLKTLLKKHSLIK